jgi:hypothetical protein
MRETGHPQVGGLRDAGACAKGEVVAKGVRQDPSAIAAHGDPVAQAAQAGGRAPTRPAKPSRLVTSGRRIPHILPRGSGRESRRRIPPLDG